jgi:hypothetical protein
MLLDVDYTYNALNIYDTITMPDTIPRGELSVVSSYSLAPFTSIVTYNDVSRLLGNTTGYKVIYETLLLVKANNSLIVVRGINRSGLRSLANYNVIEGKDLNDSCLFCAWIGEGLAEKLGLHIGDNILVYSFFNNAPVKLRVEGILGIRGPYRYEAIVSLRTGQLLRGINDRSASIALIIGGRIPGAANTRRQGLMEYAFIVLRHLGRKPSLTRYGSASSAYLSRIGVPREALAITIVALITLLSIGSYVIGSSLFHSNRPAWILLHDIGVPLSTVKIGLIILLTIYVLIDAIVSILLQPVIIGLLHMSILNYPVTFNLDLQAEILITLLTIIFSILGVTVGRLNEQG